MLIEAEDYKNGMKLQTGVLYNGSDGTYRYADNKMYSAIVKVPTPFSGDELKEQIISVKLPKIPNNMFMKIYEFFKYIYKKFHSEVAVLLWYNFDTNTWETEVPRQTCSGGGVNYTRDEEWATEMTKKGFLCVGTIHSHCEMGAFHSGTDDHDEYNFDGVHITIGKVLSGPEFAQRFIVKQMSKKIDSIYDVVEKPDSDDLKFPKEWGSKVQQSQIVRKSSIFGNHIKERTVNMCFNSDGSLRKPMNSFQYTDDNKFSKAEKTKRASVHYLEQKDAYLCPLCFEETSRLNVGKDLTCVHCGFPFWEDEDYYELNSVETKNGESIEMAIKEEPIDDYIQETIDSDFQDFLKNDNQKHTI